MALPFTELVDNLPECASPCAFEALNYTACAVTNFTSSCLCRDGGYIEMYRMCVRASCDMAHTLMAKNATWVWCGLPYHNQTGNVVARIFVVGVTAFFFIVRQIVKMMGLSAWGLDDLTLVIGFLLSLSFAVSKFYGYELGFGRDVWSLSHEEITRFMQIFFAFEIIYIINVAALKASILFFYQRVFHLVSPRFTVILWCTQAFNLFACIAFTVAGLKQCTPMSYAWEGWDGRHEGYCLDLMAMLVSHAAVSIALDVWMLVLPATKVLWLNLRKRQKMEILAMFGLGIVITVVSIIRLKVLLSFRYFTDPTYNAFYLHMWSYIEISVGVIVACLPSARQLWRELLPRIKRMIGLRPNLRPSQPGDSARRLKDILFLSGDQLSPTSGGFMTSSTRTRSGGMEDDGQRK
ncbi:CFEM domain-containing protein [Colletotrichum plurivorum]|uniref:CFEM domain-containing protein n=1 Tax=Colletotrichum plurivorum TaxID=2175906 RepID=A0A8H6N9M4_9PEZI|nr:CFEM domain-containing protein [Colletotrichum plurivorum]